MRSSLSSSRCKSSSSMLAVPSKSRGPDASASTFLNRVLTFRSSHQPGPLHVVPAFNAFIIVVEFRGAFAKNSPCTAYVKTLAAMEVLFRSKSLDHFSDINVSSRSS